MVVAALVAGAVVTGLMMWTLMRPASDVDALPVRFELLPPPTQLPAFDSVAPWPSRPMADTSSTAPGGRHHAVVRARDRQSRGSTPCGYDLARQPFFSPDNRWIAFFDNTTLKKVPVTGGPAVTIAKAPRPRARRKLGR